VLVGGVVHENSIDIMKLLKLQSPVFFDFDMMDGGDDGK
jgi:hypothetical protein